MMQNDTSTLWKVVRETRMDYLKNNLGYYKCDSIPEFYYIFKDIIKSDENKGRFQSRTCLIILALQKFLCILFRNLVS